MNSRQLCRSLFVSTLATAASSAWLTGAVAAPVIFSDSGATGADILAEVTAFQAALGNLNGNDPGPLLSGRREINWDGGNPALTNGTAPVTPFNVFRDTRGAAFTTPGIGLTQAARTGGALSLDLINPSYATAFATFSPSRLFTPLGSNITDGQFSIPGTNGGVAASISGFGAVFTDVDLADSSSIQFFDVFGASLGEFDVPAGTTADGSLSFLGVLFNAGEQIARVSITSGTTALGPTDNPGGGVDVVVMDDFIYAEPSRIVPEPGTALLFALGLLAWAWAGTARRRRGRR